MKKLFTLLTILIVGFTSAFAETWTVAGTAVNGSTWDPSNTANDMTNVSGTTWKLTVTGKTLEQGTTYEYKVVKDHSWSEAYPSQNQTFTVSETAVYTIEYTFNSSTKAVSQTTTKTGSAGGITHTWTVAGSSAVLFGSAWDPSQTSNDLVEQSDGTFKKDYSNVALSGGTIEYKIVQDHAWGVAYPSSNATLSIPSTATYNVTFTFNPTSHAVNATATAVGTADPEVFLRGGFDSWGAGLQMTKAATGNVFTLTTTFADETEFKFTEGATWYGTTESAVQAITEATKDNIATSTDGGAQNFSLPAGEWTFTFNLDNATFSVAGTWPVVPVQNDVYILGNGGWDPSVGVQMETTDDVIYSKTITTADSGDGYAYIGFSTKLGSSSTDWDGIAAYRFGPEADGDNYWITETTINTDIAYVTSNYKSIRIPAGMEVTVSVNKTAQTFRVAGTWPAPADPEVYLFGSFDSWATGLQMIKEATGNVYTLTTTFAAESEFKFLEGSTWYGTTESAVQAITEATKDNIATSTDGGAQNFSLPAGEWTFTFNLDNGTFSVAGTWPVATTDLYLKGSFDSWADGAQLTKQGDGTYTLTQTFADEAEFKFLDSDNVWYGVSGDAVLPITEANKDNIVLSTAGGAPNFSLPAGEWTFTVAEDFSSFSVAGTWPVISNTPDHLYFMGDQFGDWAYDAIAQGKVVELDKNGDVFTYTGHVDAGYFCLITQDAADWGDLDNYRYGKDNNDPEIAMDTQYTLTKGTDFHLTLAGTYTFTVDFSGTDPVFSFTGTPDPVSNAPEHLYFMGDNFGNWDAQAIANGTAVELTKNGDVFTYTGHVDAGYFCLITADGEGADADAQWADLNSNYRYGSNSDGNEEDVVADTQYTMAKGARTYHLTAAGTYTFTVDFSGANPVFSFTGTPDPVSNAPEHLYFIGNEFGGWDNAAIANGTAVELTKNGDIFTYTGHVGADGYFCFITQDGTDWDDLDNYRYGSNDESTQEDVVMDTQYTMAKGKRSYHLAAAGTYTFTVDFSGANPVFSFTGTPDPVAAADLYLKGSFDTWGTGVQFTDNGDGTYTLADYVLADDTEFQVYDATSDTWYGHNGTAQIDGANHTDVALATGYANNFTIAAGTYTFVVDFDAKTMTVTGTWSTDLYLKGSFDTWGAGAQFTDNGDGTYTLADYVLADDTEFKVYDVGTDTWYGHNGTALINYANHENVTIAEGNDNNFSIAAGTYTFVVNFDNKTMTVSGNFVNPNAGKTLQLRGSFNTWGDSDVFTDNNDGTYTITLQMNKEDEFKIVEVVDPSDSNQDVWYGYNTGSADLFWLNGQARTNVAMEDGNNYYVAVSGEWTITVDYAAKTFNADRVIEKYGVLGDAAIFGTAWDNDVELEAMPTPGDYTVTLSNVDIAAGDYEYKARADKDWGWYDLPAAGNNTLNVPESGLYDITFTMSTLNHDIVAYLTPVTSIALTISDAEYATIYYENVAFEIPEGVTASTYKVQEGHMVASKNVTKNPAGQALVLYKAGGGDITLNIINTGMEAADNENLLVGSVFNEEGISEAGYTYFYLCRKDGTGKVGFYYFTADGSSVNNNAHKAYMRVPNDQVPAGVMGFAFDDALTGITGINAEEILSDGPVYTLSGVRVQNAANLQKGIYVKNGRKFIVK